MHLYLQNAGFFSSSLSSRSLILAVAGSWNSKRSPLKRSIFTWQSLAAELRHAAPWSFMGNPHGDSPTAREYKRAVLFQHSLFRLGGDGADSKDTRFFADSWSTHPIWMHTLADESQPHNPLSCYDGWRWKGLKNLFTGGAYESRVYINLGVQMNCVAGVPWPETTAHSQPLKDLDRLIRGRPVQAPQAARPHLQLALHPCTWRVRFRDGSCGLSVLAFLRLPKARGLRA